MTEIDRLDHNFERKWVFKRLDLVKMGGFWEEDEQFLIRRRIRCDPRL